MKLDIEKMVNEVFESIDIETIGVYHGYERLNSREDIYGDDGGFAVQITRDDEDGSIFIDVIDPGTNQSQGVAEIESGEFFKAVKRLKKRES